MSYPFLQSRWYTPGPRRGPINKICLHTMEAPCERGWAKRCAEIAAVLGPDRKVSAHFYVDPSEVWQGVRESDIAYTAPGANNDAVNIEQAGYAGFSDADWSSPNQVAMEQVVAALIVDLHIRYDIPLRFCTAADMLADPNAKGVTTHAEVNRAFHRSDHTDPGPNYPLDYVLIEARALLNPPPPSLEDEVPYVMIAVTGYSNVFAAFDSGAIRQMVLAELNWLKGKGVEIITDSTADGANRLIVQAGGTVHDLVPV